ncbi:MAG TPA: GHKL domain-containing protein [Candidatus Faecisoma merdavium]|nr:GHKL domain-containing protein [Candidatus Faecisoma merdavium]
MLEVIRMYFLPCLINVITGIYLVKKILNEKYNCLNFMFLLKIVLLTFIMIVLYIFVSDYLRFFFSTIVMLAFSLIIFKSSKEMIIISTLIEQLIVFICELLFALFLILISNVFSLSLYDYKGNIITNIFILILSFIIINNRGIMLIIQKIIKLISDLKLIIKYILLFVLLFTTNVLLVIIYLNYENTIIMILNLFFMCFYSFLVFSLINEVNSKNNYMTENKILLSNLNEYEKMLDYQRVNNHENKNQLLVIKSMVEKEDKKTIEYINEIIKEKREDNELMYTKAKRIPSGGLQGLVYQKMLVMQENYINVILNVSSNVRKIDFSNLSSKMNYDICRIMGIILDNAIEETIKFNRKEREIVISMYIDELFIIEVSNRIKDNIDLDKIYDKGYTSKEKGHGYGLSLLKKIVDENINVTNELKITNDIFTQIIKIKM